jgi:NAD(P)-dependent dehydrogenase (short-subunit alcohol dehydrogenase family)
MSRLEGRKAIVMGAGCAGSGWGNGCAVAVRFVQEGAMIAAADRDPAAMEETIGRVREAGGDIIAFECDVTDSASVAFDEARFVTGTEIVVDGGMTVRCD